MSLEKEVLSFELSKRLFQLGFQKKKSLFSWQVGTDEKPTLNLCFLGEINCIDYPSFTAAELLYMLPHTLSSKEPDPFNTYRLVVSGSIIVKNPEHIDPIRTTIVNYRCDTISMENKQTILEGALGKYLTQNIWDENPSNALAKMLIYLVENDLMVVVQ